MEDICWHKKDISKIVEFNSVLDNFVDFMFCGSNNLGK